ncbi:MAG: 23S rRNA pseudouridine(1911/1915/1917) synthase RluD [Xanthomonadales bacterium]|nr:23S rRNA pseudouridine(1911/1915/1917) synthase RluD [Xanthomonadales bacterium]
MNDFVTNREAQADAADDQGSSRVDLSETLPMHLAGLRFDQALAEMFPQYSRSRLAAWIKSGAATLNGRSMRPKDAVLGGEKVCIAAQLEAVSRDRPEAIALEVLHEDEHLFVINKPAGLVVHPGAGRPGGTLVNALLHRDARLEHLPRAGIVHRLDKDTSGALLVARTLEAHTALVAMLAERAIHRQYEAVVQGVIVAGGTIDAPMDRHPTDRLRRAVREDGRPAVTHFRVRDRYRAHSLVECRLETGRTHQIRVHMQHRRFPIVGDPLYGGGLRLPKQAGEALIATLRGFRRQALHAEQLSFDHPFGGATVTARAPRPADLAALIGALAKDRDEAAS